MRETVTISLPGPLRKKLDKLARKEHLNRSDVMRDALRSYLSIQEFRRLRAQAIPYAEKQGIFTDEDVFKVIS